MAYTEEFSTGSVIPAGTTVQAAIDLTATASVLGEWIVMRHGRLRKIMFAVTTAVVATTTAPVVRISRRVTPGSDTGAVVVGTLTIPTGTAVGKVLYKDISPVNFSVGDTIKIELLTQGVGSAAGAGYVGFDMYLDPETSANEADMIASV